jgi:protein-L-isoaspartate O-methyltransferase
VTRAQESVRGRQGPVSVAELLRGQQTYYDRWAQAGYPVWIEDYMRPVADQVERALQGLTSVRGADLQGDVLELGCGSGYVTRMLSAVARHVTAVDEAPAMLDHVRAMGLANVEAKRADVFAWEPQRRWDAVVMAQVVSEVPMARFEALWDLVGRALAPGGAVVVLDVTREERAIEEAYEHEGGVPVVLRRVAGEEYKVAKLYWRPADLLAAVQRFGWRGFALPIGQEAARGFALYRLQRSR